MESRGSPGGSLSIQFFSRAVYSHWSPERWSTSRFATGFTCNANLDCNHVAQPHRTAGARSAKERQRPGQQAVDLGIVLRPGGMQDATFVGQPGVSPKNLVRTVVRLNDPPAPLKLDDARPGAVEEIDDRQTKGARFDERRAHPNVLAKVWKNSRDHVEPRSALTVSRAMTRVPMAACTATSNMWRSIFLFELFSRSNGPRRSASMRSQMMLSASTRLPLTSTSIRTRSAGK